MIDWPLITSLVERWWPKTHTFHVLIEEMSITLQDVAIILGLCIHGPVVTGTYVFDVAEFCGELLGVTHSLILSEDSLSLHGGYVTSYPP